MLGFIKMRGGRGGRGWGRGGAGGGAGEEAGAAEGEGGEATETIEAAEEAEVTDEIVMISNFEFGLALIFKSREMKVGMSMSMLWRFYFGTKTSFSR